MYLGGYSATEAAAGVAKQINGYNGLKNAITAIDPDATVDYMKGFTGTGTTAAAADRRRPRRHRGRRATTTR